MTTVTITLGHEGLTHPKVYARTAIAYDIDSHQGTPLATFLGQQAIGYIIHDHARAPESCVEAQA